jgi:thioredoxin-dependent peroxiredoxin
MAKAKKKPVVKAKAKTPAKPAKKVAVKAKVTAKATAKPAAKIAAKATAKQAVKPAAKKTTSPVKASATHTASPTKAVEKSIAKPMAPKAAVAPANGKAPLALGASLPEFDMHATGGKMISLGDLVGKKIVLYFYPKDSTPGCTLEGYDFKKLHADFQKKGCLVFGVSREGLKSHEKFKHNCGFPFELLSDEDSKLCNFFKVIGMKSMYGRQYEGIERSTFVFGADGKLKKEWRNVKVPAHAAEVLEFVKSI